MKKLIKKYWPLLTAFIIGSIINAHYFIPSWSFDGYCNLCDTFKVYALHFIKAGRYFSALIYFIVDLLKIDYSVFSTISIIFSLVFLSCGVYVIHKDLINLVKKNILTEVIIFIGAFLICFNPFNAEFFVFEEGFSMSLGILLSILSASIFFKQEKNYFIKSFLALLFAAICYQSTVCMFLPYAFLLITLDNKKKNIIENIKDNWKKYIIGLIIYGSSLLSAFLLLKIILKIFALNSYKFGELNILTNIKTIFRLFKEVSASLLFFIKKEYFYGVINIVLFITIPLLFINFKKNINRFIFILIMCFLCMGICFVPNLAMNSSANYTAARMLSSFGATPGFIILMLLVYEFNKKDFMLEKYFHVFIVIIGIIYTLTVCCFSFNASSDSYKRYQNDLAYLNNIEKNVKNIDKFKNVYYVIDSSVQPFYKDPINGNNYRMYFFGWAFECGYKAFINDNVNLKQIQNNEIKDYDFISSDSFEYYVSYDNLYLILKQ